VKRLIIYETTHHEILPAMLDLAVTYFEDTLVFLDDISYKNLNPVVKPENRWPGVQFFRRMENENHRDFINSMFDFARKGEYSHLHLSTLSNNYLFLTWKLLWASNIQVSLTVHEVNLFRSFSFNSLRDITESIAKFFLYRRINCFRGLIPQVKIELDKYLTQKKAVFIPSQFYVQRTVTPVTAPWKVVVPGTVEAHRRDYEFLLDFTANYLARATFKQPVELILLGYAGSDYGKDILGQLQGSANEFLKIIYFREPVSAEEYARHMNDAKIIWSPICVVTFGSRGQEEVYGITKSAGLTGDLIRFPKPTLVPADFNIPFYLQHTMIRYLNKDDLLRHMKRLFQEDNLDLMQKIEKDISFLVPARFSKDFETLMQFK
jgi:hypothetical protein